MYSNAASACESMRVETRKLKGLQSFFKILKSKIPSSASYHHNTNWDLSNLLLVGSLQSRSMAQMRQTDGHHQRGDNSLQVLMSV